MFPDGKLLVGNVLGAATITQVSDAELAAKNQLAENLGYPTTGGGAWANMVAAAQAGGTIIDGGYINTQLIVANAALIAEIFSKAITIQTGGHIKGGTRYDESGNVVDSGVPGFYLGVTGACKANDAYFDNCTVSGYFSGEVEASSIYTVINGSSDSAVQLLKRNSYANLSSSYVLLQQIRLNARGSVRIKATYGMYNHQGEASGQGQPVLAGYAIIKINGVDITSEVSYSQISGTASPQPISVVYAELDEGDVIELWGKTQQVASIPRFLTYSSMTGMLEALSDAEPGKISRLAFE